MSRPAAQSLVATLVLLLAASIFTPFVAYADVNDFTATNFTAAKVSSGETYSADYYFSNEYPQGSVRVQETITVNLAPGSHGINVYFPLTHDRQPLNQVIQGITTANGDEVPYVRTKHGDNDIQVQIGDPSRTVEGEQTYRLNYTMDNVIAFGSKDDEFDWTVNDAEWSQPLSTMTVRMHFPAGLKITGAHPDCAVDVYATSSNKNDGCHVADNNGLVVVTASNLANTSTVSVNVGFAKGFFTPRPWYNTYFSRDSPAAALVPPLVITGVAILWWRRRYKASRKYVPDEVQTALPAGFSPIELYALQFGCGQVYRGMAAEIIDLSMRGYIRIVEENVGAHGQVAHIKYSLELTNEHWDELRDVERRIMVGIFGIGSSLMRQVHLSQEQQFTRVADSVRYMLAASFKKAGYFHKDYTVSNMWLVYIATVVALLVSQLQSELEYAGWVGPALGLDVGIVLACLVYGFRTPFTPNGGKIVSAVNGYAAYLSKKFTGPRSEKKTQEIMQTWLVTSIITSTEDAVLRQLGVAAYQLPAWYARSTASTDRHDTVGRDLRHLISQIGDSFFIKPVNRVVLGISNPILFAVSMLRPSNSGGTW